MSAPLLPGHLISDHAFERVRHSLGDMHHEILAILGRHGAMTANQLANRLTDRSPLNNQNVCARCGELLLEGKIVIDRLVRDPISKQKARQYRLPRTGEVVHPPAPKLSRKQLEAEINRLKDENYSLQKLADEAVTRLERMFEA